MMEENNTVVKKNNSNKIRGKASDIPFSPLMTISATNTIRDNFT